MVSRTLARLLGKKQNAVQQQPVAIREEQHVKESDKEIYAVLKEYYFFISPTQHASFTKSELKRRAEEKMAKDPHLAEIDYFALARVALFENNKADALDALKNAKKVTKAGTGFGDYQLLINNIDTVMRLSEEHYIPMKESIVAKANEANTNRSLKR